MPEGYVEPNSNNGFDYVYQYADTRGNIRLSYTDANKDGSITTDEIFEENNYYPFGLKHQKLNPIVSSLRNDVARKFKYNGVEQEDALGIDLYEMEVRQYDPAIARFTGIDPVTHHSMSTYTAFDNNPVYFADPAGANAYHEGKGQDEAEKDSHGRAFSSQGRAIHTSDRGGLSTENSLEKEDSSSDSDESCGPQDCITVNSEGVVTNVEENEEPNKFFDEDGNELSFNDSEIDFLIINKWQKGDRLFFPIGIKELVTATMEKGGLSPLLDRASGKTLNGYLSVAFSSHFGGSDFTFSHLIPNYLTNQEQASLEYGVFRTKYETNLHFFRFGESNNLYNLYDAGNFMWGFWMRSNGFKSGEVKAGSNLNEFYRLGDDAADQRAVFDGFNLRN